MLNALQTSRPDLVRARAIREAMQDSRGKQIRSAEEAETWVDGNRPDLTDAWLSWVGENLGKPAATDKGSKSRSR
jgi:hypothetical protein